MHSHQTECTCVHTQGTTNCMDLNLQGEGSDGTGAGVEGGAGWRGSGGCDKGCVPEARVPTVPSPGVWGTFGILMWPGPFSG